MPECKEMLFFVPYGSKVLIRFPFRTLFDDFSFAVIAPRAAWRERMVMDVAPLAPRTPSGIRSLCFSSSTCALKRLDGFVPRVGHFLLGVGFALWLLQASPSCLMDWF